MIFPKGKDGSKPKEHVTGECERRGQRAHRRGCCSILSTAQRFCADQGSKTGQVQVKIIGKCAENLLVLYTL